MERVHDLGDYTYSQAGMQVRSGVKSGRLPDTALLTSPLLFMVEC